MKERWRGGRLGGRREGGSAQGRGAGGRARQQCVCDENTCAVVIKHAATHTVAYTHTYTHTFVPTTLVPLFLSILLHKVNVLGSALAKLHEIVPPESLPKFLGGTSLHTSLSVSLLSLYRSLSVSLLSLYRSLSVSIFSS